MNDLSEEEMMTLFMAMDTRILVLDETAKSIACTQTKKRLTEKREEAQRLFEKLKKGSCKV